LLHVLPSARPVSLMEYCTPAGIGQKRLTLLVPALRPVRAFCCLCAVVKPVRGKGKLDHRCAWFRLRPPRRPLVAPIRPVIAFMVTLDIPTSGRPQHLRHPKKSQGEPLRVSLRRHRGDVTCPVRSSKLPGSMSDLSIWARRSAFANLASDCLRGIAQEVRPLGCMDRGGGSQSVGQMTQDELI
jgi:hypothetical protein